AVVHAALTLSRSHRTPSPPRFTSGPSHGLGFLESLRSIQSPVSAHSLVRRYRAPRNATWKEAYMKKQSLIAISLTALALITTPALAGDGKHKDQAAQAQGRSA